jgi:hypothetical protein
MMLPVAKLLLAYFRGDAIVPLAAGLDNVFRACGDGDPQNQKVNRFLSL